MTVDAVRLGVLIRSNRVVTTVPSIGSSNSFELFCNAVPLICGVHSGHVEPFPPQDAMLYLYVHLNSTPVDQFRTVSGTSPMPAVLHRGTKDENSYRGLLIDELLTFLAPYRYPSCCIGVRRIIPSTLDTTPE